MGGNIGTLSAAKRRQKRVKMVVSVRVLAADPGGDSHEQLAHTLDITYAGVRIAGLQQPLTAGEVVRLQRGANRRCFRVVWSNQVGGAYQAGLEAVEPLKQFWNLQLPEDQDEYRSSGPTPR
jgi:hypothetical protein